MKVVVLSAGSGAMYCGACAHDAELARGLQRRGHQAVVFPLYTPLRLEDEPPRDVRPIRFGGVNAYLREVVPGYRHWPRWLRGYLDRPQVLAWASQFAVRTRAADLGPMTVSVLSGGEGKHAEEIRTLAEVVRAEEPDVVLVANSLLLGFVPALRRAGGFRIVCQAQGEDGFLDELPNPWRERAIGLMRSHAGMVDRFLAPSHSHAQDMAERLGVPADRFAVLPHPAPLAEAMPLPEGPPMLGHLSSIRRAKGLDILLRAMARLPSEVRLRIGGKVLERDFFEEVRRLAAPLGDRVVFEGEIAPSEKAAFFRSVDAVVLPSRLRESRGIVALEALAHARPVVASDAGIYAEFAAKSPGILLHSPGNVDELVLSISKVLARDEAARRGALGREMVRREYAPAALAERAEAILQETLS